MRFLKMIVPIAYSCMSMNSASRSQSILLHWDFTVGQGHGGSRSRRFGKIRLRGIWGLHCGEGHGWGALLQGWNGWWNVITQNDSSWSYLDFVKFSAFWGLIWSELIFGRAWSLKLLICQSCGFSEDFAKWKAQEEQREKREALGKNCIGTAVLIPEDNCQLWGFQSHQMSEVLCYHNSKSKSFIGLGTPLALCPKNNLNRQNCAKSKTSLFLSWLFFNARCFKAWFMTWPRRFALQVQLKTWPRVSELPPVPTVTDPCLDILKDRCAEKRRFVGSAKMWEVGSWPRETAQKKLYIAMLNFPWLPLHNDWGIPKSAFWRLKGLHVGSSSLLFGQDDKWVERHTLSSSRQRWTLGRAVGEVDFVMNHPSISRRYRKIHGGQWLEQWRKYYWIWLFQFRVWRCHWTSMFTSLACTSY